MKTICRHLAGVMPGKKCAGYGVKPINGVLWRRIWLALAKAEAQFGLVNSEQIAEISQHVNDVDIDKALEIEAEIHHDLMAELKTFALQCPNAGGVLHMGATSMDIEDNADALRLRSALDLILESLRSELLLLVEKLEEYADIPIMAYTHMQPAEPTTLGYRFAIYAQDLLEDWQMLSKISEGIRGKGFKGAVGNAAAYGDLLGIENQEDFENLLSEELKFKILFGNNPDIPSKTGLFCVIRFGWIGSVFAQVRI